MDQKASVFVSWAVLHNLGYKDAFVQGADSSVILQGKRLLVPNCTQKSNIWVLDFYYSLNLLTIVVNNSGVVIFFDIEKYKMA